MPRSTRKTTSKTTKKASKVSRQRRANSEKPRFDWLNRSPVLSIAGMSPGSHKLRFVDSKTPDRNAKPQGATELQLFVAITDSPNASIEEARYHGKLTICPAVVKFEPKDDGKVATHYGRWVSARGEHGPWSAPVSLRIAA